MSTRNPQFTRYSHGWIYKSLLFRCFRSFLALSLAALTLAAPLSFTISARSLDIRNKGLKTDNSANVSIIHDHAGGVDAHSSPRTGDDDEGEIFDRFIVNLVNGVATCREATLLEAPITKPTGDDPGVPIRKILQVKKENSDTAHASSQATDNANTGLTINLIALNQLQTDTNSAQVMAAIQRAAAVWESKIKNPITIDIRVDYGNRIPDCTPDQNATPPRTCEFSAGTLAAAGSASTQVDFQGLRTNLLLSASSTEETNLYNALPASVVPSDIGNGAVIRVTRSTAKALGISTSTASVATIGFNKKFAYDFNPDDGISSQTWDFVGVATHEIGHALGFTSGASESSTSNMRVWDIFRFRPGMTFSNFTNAERIMSIGGPNTPPAVNQVYFTGQSFNFGSNNVDATELGLSTGGPEGVSTNNGDNQQSSHWKDDLSNTGNYIGIMDPTIPSARVQVATNNDFKVLETIGWNLVSSAPPPPPPPAPAPPSNDNFANAQGIAGCSGTITSTNVGATRESGEQNHAPDNGGGSRSVWYQWQAPSSGSVTITTAGSSFDTVLAVYTGTSVSNTTAEPNGKNDDVGSGDTSSSVTFTAQAGTVYRIAVDGYNNSGSGGDFGSFKLNWNQSNCSVTPPGDTIQITAASTPFNEATVNTTQGYGVITVQVTRSNPGASAVTVQYSTEDAAGGSDCNVFAGHASQRCDYATAAGTLRFAPGEASKIIQIPVVPDGYIEGNETFNLKLQNATGATLGGNSQVTLVIQDRGVATTPAQNPYIDNSFFVRQLYLDILGREPDAGGFATWTGVLNNCGPEKGFLGAPRACDRAFVSHGFVASPEFTDRGYYLHRMYEVGARRLSRYSEFVPEMAGLSGAPGSAELEQNAAQFAENFVLKQEFVNNYGPVSSTAQAAQYIALLEQNAGVSLPASTTTLPGQPPQYNRQDLINKRASGEFSLGKTLRAFVEQKVVYDRFFERGFVTIQYFGFLRRDPDLNDAALAGWTEWVFVFTNGGAARGRPDIGPRDIQHLIFGFIYSEEYRKRFGQP